MNLKDKIRKGIIILGSTSLLYGGIQGCATSPFTNQSKTFQQETAELNKCNEDYARGFFRENEFIVPDNVFEAIEKTYAKHQSKKIEYGSWGCYIQGRDFSKELFRKTLSEKLKNKSPSEIENIIELLKDGNILIKNIAVRNYVWDRTLGHERAHKTMDEKFTEEENQELESYMLLFVSYLKEQKKYKQLIKVAEFGYGEFFADCVENPEMIVELAGAKAPQSIINLYGRLAAESRVNINQTTHSLALNEFGQ